LAEKTNLNIEIGQIGFENFTDKHLKIYNKGYSVKTNLDAIELLLNLNKNFKNFNFYKGNNMILFNPWTTLKDIEENLNTINELREKGITCNILKLNLYGNYLPIFKKIEKEGLLVIDDYKYEYKFRDKDTALFYEIYEDLIYKISSKKYVKTNLFLWSFITKNHAWICNKLLFLFKKYGDKSLAEKKQLIRKDSKILMNNFLSLIKSIS